MNPSDLLTSDNVRKIAFSPELASIIGLNECIFLSQLEYWLSIKESSDDRRTFREGRMWVYNSYDKWLEQFPFWSKNTLIRTVKSLEGKGIIITGNFNSKGYDKKKWYSVDYHVLSECKEKMDNSKTNNPSTQNGYINLPKMGIPSTQNEQTNSIEYYIEYNKEKDIMEHSSRNARCGLSSDGPVNYVFLRNQVDTSLRALGCYDDSYLRNEVQRIVYYYYHRYHDVFEKPHIMLKQETMDNVVDKILSGSELVTDVSFDIYQELINRFFQSNIDSDYHITHFVSGFVRDYRWFESGMGGGELPSYV